MHFKNQRVQRQCGAFSSSNALHVAYKARCEHSWHCLNMHKPSDLAVNEIKVAYLESTPSTKDSVELSGDLRDTIEKYVGIPCALSSLSSELPVHECTWVPTHQG